MGAEPLAQDAPMLRERLGILSRAECDLRHTFGTPMAAAGAPMPAVQEWLGHRDFRTTLVYADYAPEPTQGAAWAARAFPSHADGISEHTPSGSEGTSRPRTRSTPSAPRRRA